MSAAQVLPPPAGADADHEAEVRAAIDQLLADRDIKPLTRAWWKRVYESMIDRGGYELADLERIRMNLAAARHVAAG